MSVVLLLVVAIFHDDEDRTHLPHLIPVECDGSKISGTDYYAGNISLDNVGIPVSSGGQLRVENHGCLFLPAIVNETGNSSLVFRSDNIVQEDIGSISLSFSATIDQGNSWS